jgi:hypothetical protein
MNFLNLILLVHLQLRAMYASLRVNSLPTYCRPGEDVQLLLCWNVLGVAETLS